MLQPLVIGLGRAGSGLHLRALAKARVEAAELFPAGPVVACDLDPEVRRNSSGVHTVDSVSAAAELLDPATTVAHVCTPPTQRVSVLAELAVHGFRQVIIEKPLATDTHALESVCQLVHQHGLDLAVVAHWLDSELTARLVSLVRGGRLGPLRGITVAQHKPRFTRSASAGEHPTAFDVEVPHSLGVVLRLAGPADLLDAEWTDMHCDGSVFPRVGSAQLTLQHHNGVRSAIGSDLTSPVQERRIALEFTRGNATGHYPISDRDHHAQLVVAGRRQIFPDDALTRFLVLAYRHFDGNRGRFDGNQADHGTFDLHCDIVRLVDAAKHRCALVPPERIVDHAG